MKKYLIYIITVPLVIAVAILILWLPKKEMSISIQKQENNVSKTEALDNFKCPEDYESQDDYARDLVMYAKNYQAKHPDSTDDDFIEERNNQLVAHNCQNNLESIFSQELKNKKINEARTGEDNSVERYGVVFKNSTSGEMRFYYYDKNKSDIMDNFEGHPWFFAIKESEDYKNIKATFDYVQAHVDYVFKITGKKEEDDCGYYGDGRCLENITIEKIEAINPR